uniref:Bm10296, isoform c n=1 Tax=Brugia malayi TaxID=6279 RepID=A0A0J9XY18_BRUMA|nr:Bm10296, isoform c [Brugia malayi]
MFLVHHLTKYRCVQRYSITRCIHPFTTEKEMLSKLILLSLITFIWFGTICRAEEEKGKCGHPKTDYSPCVTRSQSDVLFRQCCQLYVPEGCHDLCQYEIEEIPARNLDNRKCCHHLNLADNKLGVGDRCLRFCDPAGQGINAISNKGKKANRSVILKWRGRTEPHN